MLPLTMNNLTNSSILDPTSYRQRNMSKILSLLVTGGYQVKESAYYSTSQANDRIQDSALQCNVTIYVALLNGCRTWVPTKALEEELDVYERMFYQTMQGIRQADANTIHQELYRLTQQRPVRVTNCKRHLEFTGHCLRMEENKQAPILPTLSLRSQ